ncbi:hypothetical protein C5O00_07230 [Pukyongia salina]|uniref:Cupin type-2 domain-containing protein n=1 Tax=Pukyongia salina TaxID=2094025 RepID=A0A2S0HWB1_9FLAO|nr:cupin domain-containing protein [Pukyongia salina]AVI50977.1 hypothetical protein C5O00_07230 [Pukyongia salina]
MLEIKDRIKKASHNGLTVQKIFKTETAETLLITLEKGHNFPEHTSPRDALLVMLEGKIKFFIQNEEYNIKRQETFSFPANEPHHLLAIENSKFLIIR